MNFITKQLGHYRDIRELKRKVATKGFGSLFLAHWLWLSIAFVVMMLVMWGVVLKYVWRDWSPEIQKVSQSVIDQMPNDLEVMVTEDWELTTNQDEPFTLSFAFDETGPKPVVFVMTGSIMRVEQPGLYLFKEWLVIRQDDSAETRTVYYADVIEWNDEEIAFPITLTKSEIATWLNQWITQWLGVLESVKWWIVVGLIVMWISGAVMTWWMVSFFLMIGYIITWSIVRLFSKMVKPLSWKYAYRMAWWIWLVIVILDMLTWFRRLIQVIVVVALCGVYLTWMKKDTEKWWVPLEGYSTTSNKTELEERKA